MANGSASLGAPITGIFRFRLRSGVFQLESALALWPSPPALGLQTLQIVVRAVLNGPVGWTPLASSYMLRVTSQHQNTKNQFKKA